MKTVYILTFLSMLSVAHASLDNCFRDAKTHGNVNSSLSPVEECSDILKSHPERIEFKDGNSHLYGLGHMVYVEKNGKRELLAGDQTELKEIIKFEVNQKKERLLILQKGSVATYKLGFIGNVTPISYFKSPIMKNVTKVKLLDNEDMLTLFSSAAIRIINSDAETRYNIEKTKPKLLNEISGEDSQLKNPSDLLIDSTEKKIYVLDSNRLLVFPANVKKDQAPSKIVNLTEARSLKQKENLIYYVNSQGQDVKIELDN